MHKRTNEAELLEALREEQFRRRCKGDLAAFARHAVKGLVPPDVDPTPGRHQELLLHRLSQVASGQIRRLLVFMPPGSAKSTYGSIIFPAWFMAANPRKKVILASNTSELAESFSRRVQDTMRENSAILGCTPVEENRSLWSASNESQFRSAGVGGTVTGFRSHLAIIDDPIAKRADAYSPTIRETTWNWYRSDFFTRLAPGGSIVVIQTRWHGDDLGGRLLEAEDNGYTVLNMPSVWDREEPEASWPDGLGRVRGQVLWPEYQTQEFLDDARKEMGELDFSALHQQQPVSAEGSLFKADRFQVIEDVSPAALKWRCWDLASTQAQANPKADYTVGVLMQRNTTGGYTVLDVVRKRLDPEGVRALIMQTAIRDGKQVRISIPQDPGAAGVYVVRDLTLMLSGFYVESAKEGGNKETRALPYAAQVNIGNVKLAKGSWNEAYREELQGFPGLKHDDQVDASSSAFAKVMEPPRIALARMFPSRHMRRL